MISEASAISESLMYPRSAWATGPSESASTSGPNATVGASGAKYEASVAAPNGRIAPPLNSASSCTPSRRTDVQPGRFTDDVAVSREPVSQMGSAELRCLLVRRHCERHLASSHIDSTECIDHGGEWTLGVTGSATTHDISISMVRTAGWNGIEMGIENQMRYFRILDAASGDDVLGIVDSRVVALSRERADEELAHRCGIVVGRKLDRITVKRILAERHGYTFSDILVQTDWGSTWSHHTER
jgi:hypothetical protein